MTGALTAAVEAAAGPAASAELIAGGTFAAIVVGAVIRILMAESPVRRSNADLEQDLEDERRRRRYAEADLAAERSAHQATREKLWQLRDRTGWDHTGELDEPHA